MSTKYRSKPSDFTRQRSIGFKGILVSILISLKQSLTLEIDNFINKLDVDDDLSYTKQAYSKARQKLLPGAFVELNDIVLEETYDNSFKTFKNYRLVAVDGSSVELPNNSQMRETYGVFSEKNNYPAGRICLTYDVLNEVILNGKLSPYKLSENAMAAELVPNIYKSSAEDICIYDRAFASVASILLHKKIGKNFIFRVQRGFLKEVEDFRNSTEDDKTIEIDITERRISTNRMKNVTEPVKFNVRCLRIKLEQEDEILITNLSAEQLTLDEGKFVYNCRWGIETNYNFLKNVLELENFTGETDIAIQQDFYATIYIKNVASLIIKDAQAEYEKDISNKNKKHECKINRSIAIGYLKRDLIHVLLQNSPEKAKRLYERFIKKLSKQVVPIRKGRRFERFKEHMPIFGRTNKKIF